MYSPDAYSVTSAIELRYLEVFTVLRKQIRQNAKSPQSIKQMAKEMHLSPERFAVLYRKFFGSSPYNEIIEARLAEAKRLLVISSQNIQEIAASCGWDDAHYFSRIFKKKTGIPPIEYRLKCRATLKK